VCELLAAAAPEPFSLERLWELAAGLERYGVAGFGWGVAWRTPDAELRHHVATAAFRDDPARAPLDREQATTAIVHLRRPSRLSTIGLPDAQPFLDPAGRFAFVHNGDLARVAGPRAAYRAQGRIAGRADSEVGQRWLEDRWTDPTDPCRTLAALHADLDGQANLIALDRAGVAHVHAGNAENPVFRFRLDDLVVVSTALYSIDRSLFRLVARGARDRRVLRPGQQAHVAFGA
jgi:glutamine phosphoribosylpyrophosphate amidotransferase